VNMTTEEITELLNRVDPPLLGVVGTIDSAGYPSTIPVWYRYDGEVQERRARRMVIINVMFETVSVYGTFYPLPSAIAG